MHAINDLALTTELNDENALLLDFFGGGGWGGGRERILGRATAILCHTCASST